MTWYLIMKWSNHTWQVPKENDNVSTGPFISQDWAHKEITSYAYPNEVHLYTTIPIVLPLPLT